MAKIPAEIPEIVKQFGPSLNRVPAGGWVASEEQDRMVKTHCCFCGQQCGIQLRVRNNKVVGWEPWADFPFNFGKLCPKGVKRYMQDEHPDRLKHPLLRVAGKGFESVSWDVALDRVASEIRRIQETYGNDAFALLTGASLTNEKAYLMVSPANCYSCFDSLGFPVLLPFFDAQSGRSSHPFNRRPGSLARSWRRPFRSRGIASPQTPTPDRESLPATIAQSIRVGPHPCRLDGALGASNSSAPVRNRTEALDAARPSQRHEQAKVSAAILTESPSEARPEGAERRTHSCGRRNEAT
jgi:hypothetical protein